LNENLDEFVFKENSKSSMSNQTEFGKTKYADKGSFLKFFNKFHKNDEFSRKGNLVNKTPSFNFIESVKLQKIVPNPVGIVKRDGDEDKINLNHYRIGDKYVQSLSHSMKLSDHISEINLSNNRLTNSSVIPLLQTIKDNSKLCRKITHLNLGYNKIGSESINNLCNFIEDKDCDLSYVNLEANCLGNNLVNTLCESIVKNISDKIKYLNLAQNNLNQACSFNISCLIEYCQFLQVIILSSNQFKNSSASLITSKVKKNNSMKVFDISWNLIGNNLSDYVPSREELLKSTKDDKKEFLNAELHELLDGKKRLNPIKNSISGFAKELGELFKEKECDLIHLDISHNNIGYNDCKHISDEIKANHLILGIHLDGNDMCIDDLGFIHPFDKNNYQSDHYASSQIYYKLERDHPLIKTNVLNVRRIRAKNNCWICEGWKETKFVYKPQQQDATTNDIDVKLHLSFDSYKAFDCILRQDQFVCHRMCPPGDLLFYYSVNNVPVENYGQITHKLKDPIYHETKNEDGETNKYIITKVGKTHAEINPNVIDSTTYKKLIKFCEPRPEKKNIIIRKVRTPWTFPISIWASYDYNYEGDSEVKFLLI
jgi:hypothetical protein